MNYNNNLRIFKTTEKELLYKNKLPDSQLKNHEENKSKKKSRSIDKHYDKNDKSYSPNKPQKNQIGANSINNSMKETKDNGIFNSILLLSNNNNDIIYKKNQNGAKETSKKKISPTNINSYLAASVFSKIGNNIINDNKILTGKHSINSKININDIYKDNGMSKVIGLNSHLISSNYSYAREELNNPKRNDKSEYLLDNNMNMNNFKGTQIQQNKSVPNNVDNGSKRVSKKKKKDVIDMNNLITITNSTKNLSLGNNNNNISNNQASLYINNLKGSNNIANSGSSSNLNSEVNSKVEFSDDKNLCLKNLIIWDIIVELEQSIENKGNMLVNMKQFQKQFLENIMEMNEIIDGFTKHKSYAKIFKLLAILFIYLKFVLHDFNYDNTMKSNVKRLIHCANEYFVCLFENIQLTKPELLSLDNETNRIITDKFQKLLKQHKTQKNTKNSDPSIHTKNSENLSNSIKQFSK